MHQLLRQIRGAPTASGWATAVQTQADEAVRSVAAAVSGGLSTSASLSSLAGSRQELTRGSERLAKAPQTTRQKESQRWDAAREGQSSAPAASQRLPAATKPLQPASGSLLAASGTFCAAVGATQTSAPRLQRAPCPRRTPAHGDSPPDLSTRLAEGEQIGAVPANQGRTECSRSLRINCLHVGTLQVRAPLYAGADRLDPEGSGFLKAGIF